LGDAPSRMSKSARRLNGVGRRDLDAGKYSEFV
jgi:hypothetical protein